jgi:small GTP-binding protein
MSTLVEKIKDIEKEISRTQINKATNSHLCSLRGKLAKYRTELLAPPKAGSSEGAGFDVEKVGDARVALIGFPSVGKSTILNTFTSTKSEAASYEFTTLTCIPGILHHRDCRVQLLDLPGIIEGASEGKGRGRQVIGVARSCDLILLVVDAGSGKADRQRELLERELDIVGLRLNQKPPNVYFKRKNTGGVSISSTCQLVNITEQDVHQLLHEYRIHSAEVLFREDCTIDQFIDIIEGNRKYVRCLYVYNKIDMTSIEECQRISSMPDAMVLSCQMKLNLDIFKEMIWEFLGLVRVYTKPRGKKPDFEDPLVLTEGRHGTSIESACKQVHRSLLTSFDYAMVWGTSVKHTPQRVGLTHLLHDEDVIQIVKKRGNLPELDPHNQSTRDPNKSRQQAKKAKAKLKT